MIKIKTLEDLGFIEKNRITNIIHYERIINEPNKFYEKQIIEFELNYNNVSLACYIGDNLNYTSFTSINIDLINAIKMKLEEIIKE